VTRAESAGRSRRPGRPIAENLSLNGHDDRPFPATLSVLSADALGRLIEVEYDLGVWVTGESWSVPVRTG
jgi:hypothetical protein